MKKIYFVILVFLGSGEVFAQNGALDSVQAPKVTINKDPRIDLLAKVQVDVVKTASRFVKGYRLFVLKTNNRDYAMKVRSYLLQNFPEEKVIMSYQAPFIKMKFGDFEERNDAERMRNQIIKGGVVTGGIYVVPDTIELKPDKIKQDDSK